MTLSVLDQMHRQRGFLNLYKKTAHRGHRNTSIATATKNSSESFSLPA